MTDLPALLSEVKRLAAKDRPIGSAAMTRLAELAVALADAVEEQWRAHDGGEAAALAAEVLRLDAAATPGPWMVGSWFGQCKTKHEHRGAPERGGDCVYIYEFRPHTTDYESSRNVCAPPNLTLVSGDDWGPQPSRVEDAALMASYRTAAPLLAREVDRLQTRISALEGGIVAEARRATAEADGLRAENKRLAKMADEWGADASRYQGEAGGLACDVMNLRNELATERGKRCGSCHWWGTRDTGTTHCRRLAVLGASLECGRKFGCVEWAQRE